MKKIWGSNRGLIFMLAGASAAVAASGCLDFDKAYNRYCETHECPCNNGETQACYTGPEGTKDVGICKGGTQTCVNEKFSKCEGEVTPQEADLCDGKDENCDGSTTTGCACKDGEKRTCSKGLCNEREVMCENGTFTCPDLHAPETGAEFCKRLVKNCDMVSAIDNCGNSRTFNCGSCAPPQTCSSSHVCECPIPTPAHTDASIALPLLSPTKMSDDVVVDATGLVWQRNVEQKQYIFNDARYYCANQKIGGCAAWRAPTKTELETLLLSQKKWPNTNTDAFPQMKDYADAFANFWTSTCNDDACTNSDGRTGSAWIVSFVWSSPDYCSPQIGLENCRAAVRCVR